jgi:Integrase core domain
MRPESSVAPQDSLTTSALAFRRSATLRPNHWTNGQVERMNRTLKEATVRRYHDETHQQLEDHLAAFLGAYNFAKRLKTLQGLTPYEAICKAWANEPERFRRAPVHLTSGLNT